jgi:hypothetical protein
MKNTRPALPLIPQSGQATPLITCALPTITTTALMFRTSQKSRATRKTKHYGYATRPDPSNTPTPNIKRALKHNNYNTKSLPDKKRRENDTTRATCRREAAWTAEPWSHTTRALERSKHPTAYSSISALCSKR